VQKSVTAKEIAEFGDLNLVFLVILSELRVEYVMTGL
jgi:hypothetical protein